MAKGMRLVVMKRLAIHHTFWQNLPKTLLRGRTAAREGQAAIDTIGLDLHKRESRPCVLTEEGEVIERGILTSHGGGGATPRPHPARGIDGEGFGGPALGQPRATR